MVDFLGLDVADTDKPGMSRLEAVIETVHPDDAAAFGDALDRCLATGESFAMRYRLRRADGVYRWMSSRAEPMRDQDGRIVQWYGLCHDIDDQMHAEEALRRSERQLRQMIDAVPVRIWSATPTAGRSTSTSDTRTFPLRYRRTSMLSRNRASKNCCRSWFIPKTLPRCKRTLRNCFETGDGIRNAVSLASRTTAPIAGRSAGWSPGATQDGTVVQWYGVSLDIDDEVRAQEELRQASEKLAGRARRQALRSFRRPSRTR